MDGIISLVLPSTKEIMRAQKELYGRGLKIKIAPMPEDISHECGVVILAREEDSRRIESLMVELALGEYKIYKKEKGGFRPL